ncbi:MAG: hypothetical protein CVU59_03380 [Deltaproteobacteria bacterium HGW-Deltaproteobacteria-17]|nr:MAG: hypothetical protein CVU59_03380 [Deltaproteobacteria bacterium HGW-Deltaproteobacteria-17]
MPAPPPSSFAADPFPLGTLLEGKIRLEKILGRGAMGVVYLATDLFLERRVAVKVLKLKTIRNPDAIERFRREAVAMAHINHPNVVQIYSFGEKDDFYYFLMEHIPGRNLADLVEDYASRHDALPLDVAIGIIAQICAGLGAVHAKGIAHRDVKPANVLLANDNFRVALTDFGLTSLSPSSRDRLVEGTPLYLAPERIRTEDLPMDRQHLPDIYAIGCIFFELLTGHPPYECDSLVELLDMHLHEEIPRITAERPDLPLYVDTIVQNAMAKDYGRRYRSCEALRAELLQFRMPSRTEKYSRPLLLLLDADTEDGEALKSALRTQLPNMHVLSSPDPEDAIATAMQERPDVIFVTDQLNGFSLLELCSRLQSSRVPVFLFLSSADNSLVFLYRELGVRGVFVKPYPMTAIMDLIRKTLTEKS